MVEIGIDIIIALGHSGFEVDKKIAQEVDGVDLVVGGHSNTFLYTGEPPKERGAFEKPEADYPYIVKRNGQDVPVVSAYKYSKYLGHLKLRVENGKVTPIKGSNPILLDKTYKQGKYKTSDFSVGPIRVLLFPIYYIYIIYIIFYYIYIFPSIDEAVMNEIRPVKKKLEEKGNYFDIFIDNHTL